MSSLVGLSSCVACALCNRIYSELLLVAQIDGGFGRLSCTHSHGRLAKAVPAPRIRGLGRRLTLPAMRGDLGSSSCPGVSGLELLRIGGTLAWLKRGTLCPAMTLSHLHTMAVEMACKMEGMQRFLPWQGRVWARVLSLAAMELPRAWQTCCSKAPQTATRPRS